MNGENIEISILVFVLILVRVTTFFAVLPFFGRQMIPSLILLGLALTLTMMWFAGIKEFPSYFYANKSSYVSWFGFFIAAGGEFLIGAMLGFSFGLFVYPVQIAGSYLAQEMGLSIASLSDPATQVNSDVVASMLQTIALLLFFCLDLHHFLLRILGYSFDVLPVGAAPSLGSGAELGIEQLAKMEQVGLSMIAPIGICLFVVLISLILLTKAAPTMNIFSIGLTIRVGTGLFFTFLFFPQILHYVQVYFAEVKEWITEFVQRLV